MLTERMKAAFGYDEHGNSPELVAPIDKMIIDGGLVPRAGGTVICAWCGLEYRQHPPVQGALYLTRTCTGIVKL